MNSSKVLAAAVGIPFAVLSGYALMKVGFMGIINTIQYGPGAWQVFADLIAALILVAAWMIKDARAAGRNVWPYLIATLCLGCFGPLSYILLAPTGKLESRSTNTIG